MSVSTNSYGSFAALLVVFAALPGTVFAATDNGTLTVGKTWVIAQPSYICLSGYTGSAGSYSPTGLTGGTIVATLYDVNFVSAPQCNNVFIYNHYSQLKITGFPYDPGQAWVTSVTCNGIAKTGVSATSFSYASGAATWTWNTSDFNFISKAAGTNVSCTIVHN